MISSKICEFFRLWKLTVSMRWCSGLMCEAITCHLYFIYSINCLRNHLHFNLIWLFGFLVADTEGLPELFYDWILLSWLSRGGCPYLVCSQWQPRWRGLCQVCWWPRHWTGMSSLAQGRAPQSSHGLQARQQKASHVDLNAPSSACSQVRWREVDEDKSVWLRRTQLWREK